jgi:hypothetical protein
VKDLEKVVATLRPTAPANQPFPRPTFFACTPKKSPFLAPQKSQKSRSNVSGV